MYSSTRGIVFRLTKYSDTSLIVRIFTEEYGLRSYLVKGARGPKSKMKASLFQPLTLLDLVVTVHEKGDLHHIREARVLQPYQSIPGNIYKTSILLFLNELLYKSIREEAANKELFEFILDRLLELDSLDHQLSHFHLLFAVKLTKHLGFYPQEHYQGERSVFALQEGCFTESGMLPEEEVIRGAACRYLADLVEAGPGDLGTLRAPLAVRNELLSRLIAYYMLHLPITGEFRSHKVLHDLFRD